MFIYEDPPTHTIHRALVSRVFTPKRVNAIEGEIRDFCAQTVEGLVGNESFDFVRDFAAEIPMRVIGMLVGIPDEAQAGVRDAFHHDMHAGTADRSKEPFAGLLDMSEWMFGEFVDWTLQHPSDDVMTQLLSQEFEDESGTTRRLRRDEVLIILTLLVSGGSDTTARLIGWAGSLLGNHPDQRRELVETPALSPARLTRSSGTNRPRTTTAASPSKRWSSTARPFLREASWLSCRDQRTMTSAASRTPSPSTYTATAAGFCPSVSAPIYAWEPTLLESRDVSHSKSSSSESPNGRPISTTPSSPLVSTRRGWDSLPVAVSR